MSESLERANFLAFLDRTAAIVNTWPEWKRNVLGSVDHKESLAMRTVTLLMDEADFDTLQREIARRQAGTRWPPESGRSGPILPDGESSLLGAMVGEMIRDLNEYRELYDLENPGM